MSQICMKFGAGVGVYEMVLSAGFLLRTCIFDWFAAYWNLDRIPYVFGTGGSPRFWGLQAHAGVH